MYYNLEIEAQKHDKFTFVTMFEITLPEKFTMHKFYLTHKDDFGLIFDAESMQYHISHGVPPVPTWYKSGARYAIYLFKYLDRSLPKVWREFAQSLGCVCGGDYGLALLWMAGKGRLPKFDFICSPYENENVECSACDVGLRYGGPHDFYWKFIYDERPINPKFPCNKDNYFVCFQKI